MDSRQRERCDSMIIQPEWGTRNVNKYFYESESRRIAAFNEIFGDVELTAAEMRTLVWLCGWEECTVENVLSAIRKAMAAEAKRREQPPVRRTEKVSALLRSVQSRRPPDVLHPRRAQRQLLMDGTAVKSAFALLSQKVTKAMRRIRR